MLKMKRPFFFYSLAKCFFSLLYLFIGQRHQAVLDLSMISKPVFLWSLNIHSTVSGGSFRISTDDFCPQDFLFSMAFCPFGEPNLCCLGQGGPIWKKSLFLQLWSQDHVGNGKDSWKESCRGLEESSWPLGEIRVPWLRGWWVENSEACIFQASCCVPHNWTRTSGLGGRDSGEGNDPHHSEGGDPKLLQFWWLQWLLWGEISHKDAVWPPSGHSRQRLL